METQEIIYESPAVNNADEETPDTQDNLQLMNMIRRLQESAESNVASKMHVQEARIKELEENLLQAMERLEPLLKFEPILEKNIHEPLDVNLYGFTEEDKQKMYVIAYDNYHNLRDAYEQSPKSKNPLNQMLSDFIAAFLRGPANQCKLASWMKNNKQRGIIINDK